MAILQSLPYAEPIALLIMAMRSLESFAMPVLIANRVAAELNISDYGRDMQREPCRENDTSGDFGLLQATAARWTMAYWLASSLPGAVTAILVGGWSDRVGRRLPILLSLGGFAACALTTLAVARWRLPLAVLVAGAAVKGLLGGYPTVLLAVYAYASDVSRPARRTARLLVLSAAEAVGMAGAQVGGGAMLKRHGVFWTTCVVLAGHALNLAYTAALLADSRKAGYSAHGGAVPRTVEPVPQEIDRFDASSATVTVPDGAADETTYLYAIRKTFRLLLKPWEHRGQFALLLLVFQCLAFSYIGPDGLTVLYAMHEPLCWTSTTTGYFAATRLVAMILSRLCVAPVLVWLKVPDRYVAQVSVIGMVAYLGAIGFARKTYTMFIGAGCMFIFGPCIITVRSMLSKLVAPKDLGAAFAILASLQQATSVASTLAFNSIYSYFFERVTVTISFLPNPGSLCFVIAMAMSFVPVILLCFLSKPNTKPETAGSSSGERKPLL